MRLAPNSREPRRSPETSARERCSWRGHARRLSEVLPWGCLQNVSAMHRAAVDQRVGADLTLGGTVARGENQLDVSLRQLTNQSCRRGKNDFAVRRGNLTRRSAEFAAANTLRQRELG